MTKTVNRGRRVTRSVPPRASTRSAMECSPIPVRGNPAPVARRAVAPGPRSLLPRTTPPHYNFEDITRDILDVLDSLAIARAHFVGISLGTILIRNMSELAPERVDSMIMGGAIIRLNVRAKLLVALGNLFKRIVPYMWLYRFFAWIIMPRERHRKSRILFVSEAKKVAQKEFIRWFRLTYELTPLLKYFEEKDTGIPTLYLMGEEDHMFLPAVRHIITRQTNSWLEVIENSGHVCNIDQPREFNARAIAFLKSMPVPDNEKSVERTIAEEPELAPC